MKQSEEASTKDSSKEEVCAKCNGLGYYWEKAFSPAIKCECYKEYLNNSELERMKEIFSDMYKNCTFENYKATNEWQKRVLENAKRYIECPNDFSIMILGQSGSGKTHIAVSIAKELMKKGRKIEMMVYPEFMLRIKSKLGADGGYDNAIKQLKYADVLIIDDLFKGAIRNNKPNETELSIMFDLIDYRYRTQKNTIITSEYLQDEMYDMNEAIAGRLKEMCVRHTIQIAKDKTRNYRMQQEVL